ncbi:hypothetical protein VKS41_008440 [Umbelopsis sp. WA50703]
MLSNENRSSKRRSSKLEAFASPIIKRKLSFKFEKFVDVDLADASLNDVRRSSRQNRRDTNNRGSSNRFSPIAENIEDISECSIDIWQAAKTANLTALKYHLKNSTSPLELVNSRDPDQDTTLLHTLCSQNRQPFQALQLLLEYGADPTARNIYGVQALHSVCLNCPTPLESIRSLIKYGADPNAKDGDGWTPLHYTARFCPDPLQSIMLLVSAGANINATDSSNKTPMFCLLANGDFHVIVQWMLANGADTTITGEFLDQSSGKTRSGTVLSQATKYARLESATILLQGPVSREALKQALKVAESRQVGLKTRESEVQEDTGNKLKTLERLLLIKSTLEERLGQENEKHRKRNSLFRLLSRGKRVSSL